MAKITGPGIICHIELNLHAHNVILPGVLSFEEICIKEKPNP